MNWFWNYDIALIGTAAVVVGAWIVTFVLDKAFVQRASDTKESYNRRKAVNTFVTVAAVVLIAILWARKIPQHGTFFGLIGAGLAIALREPLLSVAGRIAIFAGHMYQVGDRIEINKMSGDIIDIGFFYTRMMEIGNWIGGDQYSGRLVQFANSQTFGTPVFNYTRAFQYIWDEIKLPITYTSNMKAASEIMIRAGEQYTKEFLEGAQENLRQMQRYFLVANFELHPQVYFSFDSNFVSLTMRYVVEPKRRRTARSFLFEHVLQEIQKRDDINFGSDTMDVTVKPDKTGDWGKMLGGEDKAA